jgi:hypothetical protein
MVIADIPNDMNSRLLERQNAYKLRLAIEKTKDKIAL